MCLLNLSRLDLRSQERRGVLVVGARCLLWGVMGLTFCATHESSRRMNWNRPYFATPIYRIVAFPSCNEIECFKQYVLKNILQLRGHEKGHIRIFLNAKSYVWQVSIDRGFGFKYWYKEKQVLVFFSVTRFLKFDRSDGGYHAWYR